LIKLIQKDLTFNISVTTIDKNLCFSFHPIHRANKRPNAVHDPNRKKSIRKFIQAVQEAMFSSSHADEKTSIDKKL
jgi:hypothetical protein